MQLGIIGLGPHGRKHRAAVAERAGHDIVVYDLDQATVTKLAGEGMSGCLEPRRPDRVEDESAPRDLGDAAGWQDHRGHGLRPRQSYGGSGDTVIDGGNTMYKDDIRRAKTLREKGIHYVDVGTSGGVWGLERGYCMMIGGAIPRRSIASIRSSRRWRRGKGTASSRTRGREDNFEPAPPRKAICTAAPPARATSSR